MQLNEVPAAGFPLYMPTKTLVLYTVRLRVSDLGARVGVRAT